MFELCIFGLLNNFHASFDLLFRMDVTLFDELLKKVKPYITKKNTTMRDSITAHDKLCVTLRFLASGESYTQLRYAFRISVASISKFVPDVCRGIYEVLEKD